MHELDGGHDRCAHAFVPLHDHHVRRFSTGWRRVAAAGVVRPPVVAFDACAAACRARGVHPIPPAMPRPALMGEAA